MDALKIVHLVEDIVALLVNISIEDADIITVEHLVLLVR